MLVSRRYLPRLSFDFASVVGRFVNITNLRDCMNKSLVYTYRKACARQNIGSFARGQMTDDGCSYL